MTTFALRLGLLMLFCLLFAGRMAGAEPVAKEYQVKAAFLYNFANFVIWPATAFADAEAPLTICVTGTSPFGNALEELTANVKVMDNRSLQVRLVETDNAAGLVVCHILFISADARQSIPAILQAIKNQPILSVAESEDFITQDCGMVRFFTRDSKIRLAISQRQLEQAGLKVNANLLSLAQPEACGE
jgi:hypothetical protein